MPNLNNIENDLDYSKINMIDEDYNGNTKNPLDISKKDQKTNSIKDFLRSEELRTKDVVIKEIVNTENKELDASEKNQDILMNNISSLLNNSQNDDKDYSKNISPEKTSNIQNSNQSIIQNVVENKIRQDLYYSTIDYIIEKTVYINENEPGATKTDKAPNEENIVSILNEQVPNPENTELAASPAQGKTLYHTLNKTIENDSVTKSIPIIDEGKNILVRDVPTKTDSNNLKVAEVGVVPKNKEIITVTKSLKNGQRTIFLVIKNAPKNNQRAIHNVLQPNISNANGRYIQNYANSPSVGYTENIQLGDNPYISPIFRNSFKYNKNCGCRGKKYRHHRKNCGCRKNNIRYNVNPNLIELGQTQNNMCRKIFCVRNRCGKLVCRAFYVPCKKTSTTITRSPTSTTRIIPPLTPV
ncbi:hypothetical protein AYI69_g8191 [Smittium culicis]|uniref:Uncharacterized protein n=1 Tax=Smittium culicis TaxID=133412 RepID=A0A1R1XLE8_9FUNG|nr:hypothetical protein AYI69_g8191 [Smittium culicis]